MKRADVLSDMGTARTSSVGPALSRGGRESPRSSPAEPKSLASDRLLDVQEAAAMLAVKPATLYQWAYQRRIPIVKLFSPRGALRFRLSDIESLIARSVRPALRESDGTGLDPQ
jgi:predicted DNA-binding transcriptional regulator AlpA